MTLVHPLTAVTKEELTEINKALAELHDLAVVLTSPAMASERQEEKVSAARTRCKNAFSDVKEKLDCLRSSSDPSPEQKKIIGTLTAYMCLLARELRILHNLHVRFKLDEATDEISEKTYDTGVSDQPTEGESSQMTSTNYHRDRMTILNYLNEIKAEPSLSSQEVVDHTSSASLGMGLDKRKGVGWLTFLCGCRTIYL